MFLSDYNSYSHSCYSYNVGKIESSLRNKIKNLLVKHKRCNFLDIKDTRQLCLIPYCLLSLCFSYFRLLIAFGQNSFKSCTLDGSLEFNISSRSLFRDLFNWALFVFSTVKDSPWNLSWISSHQEGSLTFFVQEIERLLNWCIKHLLVMAK